MLESPKKEALAAPRRAAEPPSPRRLAKKLAERKNYEQCQRDQTWDWAAVIPWL
jgi:hypothetical protein